MNKKFCLRCGKKLRDLLTNVPIANQSMLKLKNKRKVYLMKLLNRQYVT